jgi:hypothetical protein
MIKRTMTAHPSRWSWQALLSCPLALAALGLVGCKQEPLCPELGTCGGDPAGGWHIAPGHPSCEEDLYDPQPDKRLTAGDVPPARQPPLDPAFTDWCGGLIAGSDDNIQDVGPVFYHESSPIGVANLTYVATSPTTGTYDFGTVYVGTYVLEFSATCMRQFGATDGKPPVGPDGLPDPTALPADICKQLEVPLRATGANTGAYFNTTCSPSTSDPGGCTCWFDNASQSGGGGTYRLLDSSTILHTPFEPSFDSRATFCRQGDTLQLTGADGGYLFNRVGLRTLDLIVAPVAPAASCTDGVQNQDETGVDCGGLTCPACPP